MGRALNTHRKGRGVDAGDEENRRLFGEGQSEFHLPCADVAGGVKLAVPLFQRRLDLLVVAVEFFHQNAVRPRPRVKRLLQSNLITGNETIQFA